MLLKATRSLLNILKLLIVIIVIDVNTCLRKE
jgi:hypothetical protein